MTDFVTRDGGTRNAQGCRSATRKRMRPMPDGRTRNAPPKRPAKPVSNPWQVTPVVVVYR